MRQRYDWGVAAVWLAAFAWCVLVWLAIIWVTVKVIL